jgi:hypothetical protein
MTTLIIIISVFILIVGLYLLYKLSIWIHKNTFKTNQNQKPDVYVIFFLLLSAILVLASPFLPFIFTRSAASKDFNFTETGEIGDTIGGLMSPFINLAAVLVTGLAFFMQYKANQIQIKSVKDQLDSNQKQLDANKDQFLIQQNIQAKQSNKEQFENHFFEMLRLHKENVNELSIKRLSDGSVIERRNVFTTMLEEFNELLVRVETNQDLNKFTFKAAYDIFFWGINELDESILNEDARKGIYSEIFKPNYKQINFNKHLGHSTFLGHYFRHLFLTVKFVVKSDVVTDYKEKMKYLKILRAQLSNHEQMMLFYNWLSDGYGVAWEQGAEDGNHFFTQYKMIHNIWIGDLLKNTFIKDNLNNLIDKYNKNPKKTPLFEFQGNDFNKKWTFS